MYPRTIISITVGFCVLFCACSGNGLSAKVGNPNAPSDGTAPEETESTGTESGSPVNQGGESGSTGGESGASGSGSESGSGSSTTDPATDPTTLLSTRYVAICRPSDGGNRGDFLGIDGDCEGWTEIAHFYVRPVADAVADMPLFNCSSSTSWSPWPNGCASWSIYGPVVGYVSRTASEDMTKQLFVKADSVGQFHIEYESGDSSAFYVRP